MANSFKIKTDTAVGTSPATIYTCPASTQTTIIGLSISNIVASQITVDVQLENNDGDNGANHSGEKESVDATDELLQAATQVANEIKTLSENKDYKNLTVNELKKLAEEKGLKKYKRLS